MLPGSRTVLLLDDVSVISRSGHIVIQDVDLRVDQGELVVLVGNNGAGKSEVLQTISGLLRPSKGTILFQSREIQTWPGHKIAQAGIAHVPENRRVFADQSVEDNLLLGGYSRYFQRSDRTVRADIKRLLTNFPILAERRKQLAGSLSGGEQQLLAIARGLMARPQLLLLDEPSLGLAPLMIKEIERVLLELRQQGTTILLVEEMALRAIAICDRGYVMQTGGVVLEGTRRVLMDSPLLRDIYLGKTAPTKKHLAGN